MSNTEYWNKFYDENETRDISNFARWCAPRVTGRRVFDLGCGDGADTKYFAGRWRTRGIDPWAPEGELFEQLTWQEWMVRHKPTGKDTLYMRWFLHAIPVAEVYALLDLWEGQILVEARLEGDESYDDSHDRWPINTIELMMWLATNGYGVAHYEEGDFDEPTKPLLFRLDAWI